MAANVVAGAVCCCSVPCPKSVGERRVLLCGGLLNILVPCGLGSLVAGCCLRDNQLINTGALQLVLTFLLVGIVWSIVYGIMMMLNALTAPLPNAVPQPSSTHLHEQAGKKPSGCSPYSASSRAFVEGGAGIPVPEQSSPLCGCAQPAAFNTRGHSRSLTTVSPKSSLAGVGGGPADPRRPSDATRTEVHVTTAEQKQVEEGEQREEPGEVTA
ncbi:transmembrane protein [Cystoisospora suis]|uniref:Transmembrane protein n=1 Tax=Cystoisospora suis TaxID=483139 RepID=A0A2C6L576_9APIC|nr:transmembrane protein [Cystoisospora suis]